MVTLYDRLEVPPDASQEAIRRAYHRLARRHHPDVHGDAPAEVIERARREMVAINAAWAVLGDPERRRRYDAAVAGHAAPSPEAAAAEEEAPEYPEWFEPDGVAAADLEEDAPDGAAGGVGNAVVFLPVALVVAAVGLFSFSVLAESSVLFGLALLLVPVAGVAFLAAPLVVLLSRNRSARR